MMFQPLKVLLHAMNPIIVSAAMICVLLKQCYSYTRQLQSICESIPHTSHVHILTHSYSIYFKGEDFSYKVKLLFIGKILWLAQPVSGKEDFHIWKHFADDSTKLKSFQPFHLCHQTTTTTECQLRMVMISPSPMINTLVCRRTWNGWIDWQLLNCQQQLYGLEYDFYYIHAYFL